MRGVVSEALASRKVVCREAYTEGSETAKSGTDEQKRNMRHICTGKQAQLCNAQRTQKDKYVDSAGIGEREKLLPGEVSVHFRNANGEISRGHSSYRKRAAIEMWKAHGSNEGLNIKMFQMQQGAAI